MIKKTLFVLLLCSQSILAQTELPVDDSKKITYSENIAVQGVNTDELHLRLKTWVMENFSNPRQSMQSDDVGNHKMIIKCTGNCYAPKSFGDTLLNGWFTYVLTIDYKDGSYSYVMRDFYSEDKWKGSIPSETWKGSKKQKQVHDFGIYEVATALTTSLKASMAKKLVVGADE